MPLSIHYFFLVFLGLRPGNVWKVNQARPSPVLIFALESGSQAHLPFPMPCSRRSPLCGHSNH